MATIISPASQTTSSSGSSTSSTRPFAPEYIPQSAAAINAMAGSAATGKDAQVARHAAYIQTLYKQKAIAQQAARNIAARGGHGDNRLAIFRAAQSASDAAGVPFDAEIAKAMLQSDSVENAFDAKIAQQSQQLGQLGSIPTSSTQQQQQSQGAQTAGIDTRIGGGGNRGAGGGGQQRIFGPQGQEKEPGVFTDMQGNIWSDTQKTRLLGHTPSSFSGAGGPAGTSLVSPSEGGEFAPWIMAQGGTPAGWVKDPQTGQLLSPEEQMRRKEALKRRGNVMPSQGGVAPGMSIYDPETDEVYPDQPTQTTGATPPSSFAPDPFAMPGGGNLTPLPEMAWNEPETPWFEGQSMAAPKLHAQGAWVPDGKGGDRWDPNYDWSQGSPYSQNTPAPTPTPAPDTNVYDMSGNVVKPSTTTTTTGGPPIPKPYTPLPGEQSMSQAWGDYDPTFDYRSFSNV